MKLNETHGNYQGRSLINRIEAQMDKRRKTMEEIYCNGGEPLAHALQKGRYEGIAASLAILRSSSVQEEISRSNKRLGISDE